MEIVNSALGWFDQITNNWGEILGTVAFGILFFDRLAKLTPTTKDDAIVNWVYKIFAILGVKVPELEYDSKGKIVTEK